MEYKSKFSDFKPEELVGKWVLYEWDRSYQEHYNRVLKKIVKVTKTGFRIYESNGLFDFRDGYQKGLNGRENIGTVSKCNLLTEEEKEQISKEWKEKKEKKEMICGVNRLIKK